MSPTGKKKTDIFFEIFSLKANYSRSSRENESHTEKNVVECHDCSRQLGLDTVFAIGRFCLQHFGALQSQHDSVSSSPNERPDHSAGNRRRIGHY